MGPLSALDLFREGSADANVHLSAMLVSNFIQPASLLNWDFFLLADLCLSTGFFFRLDATCTIPDGPPLQLAEQVYVLHRQILLLTAGFFGNLFDAFAVPFSTYVQGLVSGLFHHGGLTTYVAVSLCSHLGGCMALWKSFVAYTCKLWDSMQLDAALSVHDSDNGWLSVMLLSNYAQEQRGGCATLCGLVPTELPPCPCVSLCNLGVFADPSHEWSLFQPLAQDSCHDCWVWVFTVHEKLNSWWNGLLSSALQWFISTMLWCGEISAAFFRTLWLVMLVYQGRLAAFAVKLRGGIGNFDPLILFLRRFLSGACWSCGKPIAQFSPRQNDICKGPPRLQRKRIGFGFSWDLLLFLLIIASLFGEASAGNGRFDGQDPTGFRATRRARKRCGSLVHLRHVARHLDSPTTTDSESEGPGRTSYFRIFGVGLWSEVMICEFRAGAGIRAVLDILEVDSDVARLSSPGHLAEVRGVPLHDFVAAVWVPNWTQYTPGAVLLIDPSLLGEGPICDLVSISLHLFGAPC